jgi:hypothetical protein
MSYWNNFGFEGEDTGDYINQFTSKLGLGKYEDNDTYYKGIFDTFDKDGNGTIEQQELGMVLRACGKNPSDNDIREMLNEMDADQDGKIDFSEFSRLIRKIASGNMIYTATSAAGAGPGRPNPPSVSAGLLTVRQNFQRSGVTGKEFEAGVMNLRRLDEEESRTRGGALAELSGNIRGIGGGVDIRSKIGGISGHISSTRGEHGSL